MSKRLIFISIICCFLSQPVLGSLELKFAGPGSTLLDAASVSTIKLTKNGEDFNVGENNFNLPEQAALSDAGLDNLAANIKVCCINTSDTTWTLKIKSSGFTNNANPTITIPSADHFKWNPVYAGFWNASKTSVEAAGFTFDQKNGGNWLDSSLDTIKDSLKVKDFVSFDNSDQTVYVSNAIDKNHSAINNTDGTQIQIQIGVVIPENQTAGTYSADLVFTLTD
jgi:hypothetical protein